MPTPSSTQSRPPAKKDDEHAASRCLCSRKGAIVLQSSLVNNMGIEAYYAGRWDEASELYRRSGELRRPRG